MVRVVHTRSVDDVQAALWYCIAVQTVHSWHAPPLVLYCVAEHDGVATVHVRLAPEPVAV